MEKVPLDSRGKLVEIQIPDGEVLQIHERREVAQGRGIENLGYPLQTRRDVPPKVNSLDEWQQAKFVQRLERVGVLTWFWGTPLEAEGMMEMGSGHDIPGEAGCGARFETSGAAHEVGDDHFQNLRGESMGLSIHRGTCSVGNPKCECTVGCGFGPLPDGELSSYDVSTLEHGNQEN